MADTSAAQLGPETRANRPVLSSVELVRAQRGAVVHVDAIVFLCAGFLRTKARSSASRNHASFRHRAPQMKRCSSVAAQSRSREWLRARAGCARLGRKHPSAELDSAALAAVHGWHGLCLELRPTTANAPQAQALGSAGKGRQTDAMDFSPAAWHPRAS